MNFISNLSLEIPGKTESFIKIFLNFQKEKNQTFYFTIKS